MHNMYNVLYNATEAGAVNSQSIVTSINCLNCRQLYLAISLVLLLLLLLLLI